jgi:hypothetical protein
MKRLLLFVALAAVCIFSAAAQDASTAPRPIIVKRVVLLNHNGPVGSGPAPVPLFTPEHAGFYRVTAIVTRQGQPGLCNGEECVSGTITFSPTGGGPALMSLNDALIANTASFLGGAGTSTIYYSIGVAQEPKPYDLVIVIEEL